jgi:hypothetical protein
MAGTDRFKPGDDVEFVCHDPDPAAPTGGWVPGTFERYTKEGQLLYAIVTPAGGGPASTTKVPIDEVRFPPPPGPLTSPPPPSESGDALPAIVNGMLVVSAFRILPVYGSRIFTWRVILRDHNAGWDGHAGTLATYTVTRVRWTLAAPGIADGEWQDIDADECEGLRGLTWTIAALTFARMIRLDAVPEDQD